MNSVGFEHGDRGRKREWETNCDCIDNERQARHRRNTHILWQRRRCCSARGCCRSEDEGAFRQQL